MEKRLKELLFQVFDDDNNVKPCGREVCKELIKAASAANPDIDYGNAETGVMNVENMIVLKVSSEI